MEASGSLFPAFGFAIAAESTKPPTADLDWLKNRSFCTKDALVLERSQKRSEDDERSPELDKSSRSDESDHSALNRHRREKVKKDASEEWKKKKKKKKREKKKKKDSRKRREESEDVGSSEEEEYHGQRKRGNTTEASLVPPEGAVRSMWLEETDPELGLFYVDRKPDSANLQFMSIYRGHIARYRRLGDSCLGLDHKQQQLLWNSSKSRKKRWKKLLMGTNDRYFCAGVLPVPGEVVRAKQGLSLLREFLPVEVGSGCAMSGNSVAKLDARDLYTSATALYLQGKSHSSRGGPQEGKPVEKLTAENLLAEKLQSRVEEFNRQLREDPHDVARWLAFIRFQDEAALQGDEASVCDSLEGRTKTRSALLERRLAIVERALEANPSSTELKLSHLEAGAELWATSQLAGEWKKLVFMHPNDASLWARYLLFAQSHQSTFSVSRVNSLYGKCLSTLASAVDGSLLSHPALPGTTESMFGIFLQQCHFLRQSGHAEKCVSLFQAAIDFNFFRPDNLNDVKTHGLVDFFETFWDSGEPHFGEKGARGWNAWMRQQERGGWVSLDQKDEGDEASEGMDEEELGYEGDEHEPRWQVWLRLEQSRERRHWIPWRADVSKGQKEEDCDDPDRQVLYDDIGKSLFTLETPELRFRLVCVFLSFLGISTRSSHDLAASALDDPIVIFSRDAKGLLTEASMLMGTGRLDFVCDMSDAVGGTWAVAEGRRSQHAEDFVRGLLEQAMQLFTGDEQAAIALAWMHHERLKVELSQRTSALRRTRALGKRAQRLAKTLLKQPAHRNRLPLWLEMAKLEWVLQEFGQARRILDTALAAALKASSAATNELCVLCLWYAKMELASGPSADAFNRTVHILTAVVAEKGMAYVPSSGQPDPPLAVLRSRKAYERALEVALKFVEVATVDGCVSVWHYPSSYVLLVCCFAFLQYASVGPLAADTIFESAYEQLKKLLGAGMAKEKPMGRVARDLELLAEERALLLRYHVVTELTSPRRLLRKALSCAAMEFPSNAHLLRLYVQSETEGPGLGIGSLRRVFSQLTRHSDSIMPWLFSLYAEMERKRVVETGLGISLHPETGLQHRIQALFERALERPSASACPLLWRFYLYFAAIHWKSEKAIGVFYRAVQACPWVKVLYLDAVRLFPERLQEMVDLLTEKELRVRLPLEELDILLE
uniref:NRDE-2, necessary for RNA interference, domain containing n=1 Tax=Eptatretus burgeri TaxID=7764 RepID=A0A8C4R166_EPTBU